MHVGRGEGRGQKVGERSNRRGKQMLEERDTTDEERVRYDRRKEST